ncbi:hypothetical protein COU59_00770 [Candidatus Pacearchaeota archaeon CG10_big_fil_rev_8_21_14_0_10_34_12]|nr:MAG: hypothetical protein COU59_00770 [Candidatus Pacearchaeota archaeon CG10_big_fil_rev_8_21_14_0_10_34_12]
MATKNVSISVEAYRKLAMLKGHKESFSDVIIREIGRGKLRDIYGILKEESGKKFEKSILEERKIEQKLHEERNKKLMRKFNNDLS